MISSPGISEPQTTTAPRDPNGCPVSDRAAHFDPFGDGYQSDPAAYVAWSRAEEPVFYNPSLGYWVVTRYDDVKAVFRDNITFSPAVALENITPTCPQAREVLESYEFGLKRTLVNEDEPAHLPRRRLLMAPFAPENLVAHEPMVRQLAREAVSGFIDRGHVDLVGEMFFELPLTVALHFLGVPEDDMAVLRRYSVAHTMNVWGRPDPAEQVAVAEAVGQFWQYSGTVLDKMRRDPNGPGWMHFAIRMQKDHPDIVTDNFLHSMMMAGIVAAHETTTIAATNSLKLLLENEAAWEAICADPTLIPNAVEECLRYDGSVSAWRRITTRATTVGAVPIPEGARLLIMQSSANHDERRFEDPDSVDLRRAGATDHLTFGYGAHQCMGKNLARMELQIILEELSRRLPHLHMTPQTFTYVRNTSFRGPQQLLVEWDPELNPERTEAGTSMSPSALAVQYNPTRSVARQVVVSERIQSTPDVVTLRLASPDGAPLPGWSPGAHVDIVCGPNGISRQYSLCGDPADRDVYQVSVQRNRDGAPGSGSAWIHEHAHPGAALDIRGPRNRFRLDPEAARYVFIAAGIGITPISAMARAARERRVPYSLHYIGRSRGSMAMLDDLTNRHADTLRLWITDENSRANLPDILAEVEPDTQVYCCGPQRMITELETLAEAWPDTLHVERFTSNVGELNPSAEHAFDVELNNSGTRVHVAADQTVLQALRTAGVQVPSDCEEGLCGTCQLGVLAGEVDHRDVVLTKAEREAGTVIVACCSRARRDLLLLDI